MERKNKCKNVGFSTILWAVAVFLLLSTHIGLATEVCVNFENIGSNGDPVAGLGTVDDLLNINDAMNGEYLKLIEEGTAPIAYEAYDTEGQVVINGCLDPVYQPGHGFGYLKGEVTGTEDLIFTFDPSITVTSFSIRMVDYGDNFTYVMPYSQNTHEVKLVAYNSEGDDVSTDSLIFTSTGYGTTLADGTPLSTAGDACLATTGQPGQWIFIVSGQDIERVELQFIPVFLTEWGVWWSVSTEADVAFDDICFTYDGGVVNIDIDIKPGSYPNSLNINGHGVIPVAILGRADFDVTEIDTSTLDFAGLAVRVKPNDVSQCSIDDVSGPDGVPDGFDDLVCQFVDDPSKWVPGNGTATLTGEMIDGTLFEGTDDINVVQLTEPE